MRAMKDSGIEWVKDIPSAWDVAYLSAVLSERKNKNIGMQENNLLSLSFGNVIRKDISTNDGLLPESFEGYNIIEKDDIVLRLTDLQNDHRSLRTGLCKERGIITSAYCTLKNNSSKCDSRFLQYYLHSFDICKGFYGMGAGVRQGLSYDGIRKIEIVLPSLAEQIAISDCIADKTEKVDALIANQEAQIEKLKAYKQSLITEVVTKGLDKNAPMKDSGIEWIGKIADNFSIMRLKNVADILDQFRKPITADQRNQEAEILYDYYGASGAIDKIDGYTIDDHVMLIGEDGANLRMRNLPLMYEVNGKAWINNHAHILKPKSNVAFYYLFYVLEGLDINPYITGSAQPKLSQENLKNIWIPIPDYNTQVYICEFIRDKLNGMELLIAIKQQKIEKLNQYKKSLIYEYVTGKKEVM